MSQFQRRKTKKILLHYQILYKKYNLLKTDLILFVEKDKYNLIDAQLLKLLQK